VPRSLTLPAHRGGGTQLLRGETGFKPEEIFRKYLRWALDQRAFDPATVSDLLNLARCCVLTDDQVRAHTP
jgi:hypothetical protein